MECGVRIAFVLNAFPAISETFILNQITALRDLNVHLDLYAFHLLEGAATHPDVSKYHMLEHVYYLPSSRIAAHSTVRPGPVGDFLLFMHSVRKTLVQGTAWEQARTPSGIAAMRRLMLRGLTNAKSQHYDVVHAHYGPLGAEVLRLQSYGFFHGPLVTSFHGFDVSTDVGRTGSGAYYDLFRRGEAFLPVTEHWAMQLRELGCPPDRIRIHRMGIDLHRFGFRPPRLPRNGDIRLLSVGRLVEKKGFAYGLRAVSALLPEFPRLRYDIVGDGPLRGDLGRSITELGLGGVVRLLGPMDQPRVLERMQSSDILLAPSVTASNGDMEGLPVVLMEAAAVGLPVVSTRHSGIPELVEHDVTGFLAEERDSAGLSEKLRHLLAAPEIWASVARRARAKIEAEHDIVAQVRNLIDLYRSVAELHGAQRMRTAIDTAGRQAEERV
jgi:colanic acid/amylovoran biosynthesis glycosyltransferase